MNNHYQITVKFYSPTMRTGDFRDLLNAIEDDEDSYVRLMTNPETEYPNDTDYQTNFMVTTDSNSVIVHRYTGLIRNWFRDSDLEPKDWMIYVASANNEVDDSVAYFFGPNHEVNEVLFWWENMHLPIQILKRIQNVIPDKTMFKSLLKEAFPDD